MWKGKKPVIVKKITEWETVSAIESTIHTVGLPKNNGGGAFFCLASSGRINPYGCNEISCGMKQHCTTAALYRSWNGKKPICSKNILDVSVLAFGTDFNGGVKSPSPCDRSPIKLGFYWKLFADRKDIVYAGECMIPRRYKSTLHSFWRKADGYHLHHASAFVRRVKRAHLAFPHSHPVKKL